MRLSNLSLAACTSIGVREASTSSKASEDDDDVDADDAVGASTPLPLTLFFRRAGLISRMALLFLTSDAYYAIFETVSVHQNAERGTESVQSSFGKEIEVSN